MSEGCGMTKNPQWIYHPRTLADAEGLWQNEKNHKMESEEWKSENVRQKCSVGFAGSSVPFKNGTPEKKKSLKTDTTTTRI